MAASLASATSSRVDSASKHIIPCRTNTDFLASLFEDHQTDNAIRELTQNKHKYSTAQNDVVIGLGRPLYGSSINSTRKKAYPSTIATLGPMRQEIRRWLAAQNFLVKDYTDIRRLKQKLWDVMNAQPNAGGSDDEKAALIYQWTERDKKHIQHVIENMLEMYFVGISLGFAHAHPHSGDTVASTMIGGLRTVLNGHFQVHTGDLLMFYFGDEVHLFEENGGRIDRAALMDAANPNNYSMEKIADWSKNDKLNAMKRTLDLKPAERERKAFYERENGIWQNTDPKFGPSRGKAHVFFIKPYVVSRHPDPFTQQPQHFPYDKFRVFGRAISNAQPWEHVDIMLSRQSI